MKRLLFGFLLAVSFIPFVSNLWAGSSSTNNQAPWGDALLTAQFLDNGKVRLLKNFVSMGYIEPQVFTDGWKIVPFQIQVKDPRFDEIATLAQGGQVGMTASVTVTDSSLYVHYRMTPLQDVTVISARAAFYLTYKDWLGAPYQVGPVTGHMPAEVQKGFLITKSDAQPVTLGPVQPKGLTVRIKTESLTTTLEDDRTWGPYFSFTLNHNEPVTPWVWKAGEMKDLDFTITFNRDFAPPPTQSRKTSKNLAGFWYAKIKSSDDLDRNDRLVLQIKKERKGKSEVYIQDLDMPSGGKNILLERVSWKGKKINAENKHLALNLSLDPLDTFLAGNLKIKTDGKIYPVSFSRGLDYTLPREDADGTAVTEYTYQLPQTLSDGWPIGDLRNSPLDSHVIQKGIDEILTQRFPNIESLVLIQNGQLILDEYFKGMGPADTHQLMSTTKSVLSILFGIAQDQGLVNVNDKLYDYFPEYRNKPGWDPRKDKITLGTLLSMTSGYACDDFVPATDCHFEMFKSSDWLDFVLSQPMNHEPGEHWAYCNDCMELLGAVIARKSGMSIPDFAQKYLYDPLGIQAHQWMTGPNQVTEVCGSHRLRPRDMAKLGYLYLKKGNWNGKQVVSEKWVEESTKPQAITPKDEPRTFDYGYLWWQEQMQFKERKIRVFNAAGLGNQYIFVVPELNLVCAMTAGNYKDSDVDSNPGLDFFKSYILGAVK